MSHTMITLKANTFEVNEMVGQLPSWRDKRTYCLIDNLLITITGEDESRLTRRGIYIHKENQIATGFLRSLGFMIPISIRGTAYIYRKNKNTTKEDLDFILSHINNEAIVLKHVL